MFILRQLFASRYGKAFFLGLSFLTRLPSAKIHDITPVDHGRSALFYPLVGLIIGFLVFLPVMFFNEFAQITIAAVVVVLWAVITGGLHLDGLADSADAWLGGIDDTEKTQRIMKDPLVGSAGVIAIVCVLLLKFAALTTILNSTFHGMAQAAGIIILVPVIARSMILLLLLTTDYMRNKGLATDIAQNLPMKTAMWIVALTFLAGFYFSFWGMIFALVTFWLLRRLMIKRLGGFTGDTLGATVEITEAVFLVGYVF